MTDTVNAILLEGDDRVLLDAIRRKRAIGWSIARIASFYNIYQSWHVRRSECEIPEKLFKVARQ